MPTGILALISLGILSAAIGVWLFAPTARGAAAARAHLGTHRLALASLVVVLAINSIVTLPIAGRVRAEDGFSMTTFVVAALATQLPMLLVVFARAVAPGAVSLQELGLRALPVGRAISWGVLVGFATLALSAVIGTILQQLGLSHQQLEQFEFLLAASPFEFLLIATTAAILVPFIEELFFRGYLFGLYRQRKPLWMAYLASGLLFALLHALPIATGAGQDAGATIPRVIGITIQVFALGTLLAWAYQRTGSLYPGMVAHGLNNGLVFALLYLVPMPLT